MKVIRKYIFCAVAVLGVAAVSEACTSWVIHASASGSGRMTVNKCRDLHQSRLRADIHVSPRGWRWMSLAELSSFGMNEKGLIATCNDGDPLTVKHPKGERHQIGSYLLLRQVLAECDNALDAAIMIRDHGRACRRPSYYDHGATLMVADPHRAFMIDLGPGYGEIKEITSGLLIISNKMHLPGNEPITNGKLVGLLSDRARESNTRRELHRHMENGKYTVSGTIRVSRAKCGVELKDKHPFRSNTQGDTCFEADPEFPAYLSTAYAAIGPQRHTVFLAFPMALRRMPKKIRSGKWAEMAYAFRKNAGDEHPSLDALYEFEAKTLPEYEKTREEARRLLRAGKTDEAVKLLNDCFERHFKAADELLTKLIETTPACADPSKNCGA